MLTIKQRIKVLLNNAVPQITEKDVEHFNEITTYKKIKNKENIIKSTTKNKKGFLILEGAVRGFITDDEGFEKNILIR